ncbi:hypothetical protein POM88_050085 [Heracleum sosnowskyi]|uniref:Uncharacterized protein n=1 Tax=Heracleum sosnowskyi TaxID=360622 RepID=A0AAD8M2A8_9APIA|nr:hypothetical protein POM88_050079 [Heracleum sosnowskyi]KAK1356829.1 hypothetical protein POM88_050085 [Heracleum sosnowskyi]
MDRAYNKLHDIDDFLGERIIGGQTVDFLRSTRQNSEKSITRVDIVVTKPKREQKLGEFHKSPFLNRAIDFNKPKLSKAEEEVWSWINGKREKPIRSLWFAEGGVCTEESPLSATNSYGPVWPDGRLVKGGISGLLGAEGPEELDMDT